MKYIICLFLFLWSSIDAELEAPSDSIVSDYSLAKEKYYEWVNSEAGKEALLKGYFKPRRTEEFNVKYFQESYERLEKLQQENLNATLSMDTPFSMMSPESFLEQFSRPLEGYPVVDSESDGISAEELRSYPNIDWTESKCVNAIKNQGQCGSCWAFGSVAALESAYCLKNGNLPNLSEQQLTSCVSTNRGCEGGWVDRTYQWIIKNNYGGVCTNVAYPYHGNDNNCGRCSSLHHVNLKSYVQLQNENNIYEPLKEQPIVVYVRVTGTWQYYKGGLLSIATGQLNHVVVVVGYEYTTSGIWKVRNSWGVNWGVKGYLFTSVSKGGLRYPIYPVV